MINRPKRTREEIQAEGTASIISNDHQGLLLMAPRTGKTKTVIESLRGKHDWKIAVSSPLEPIRKNWLEEAKKWELDIPIKSVCSRSLDKLEKGLDLLIVDEPQDLSFAQINVIKELAPKRVLYASGTVNAESRLVLDFNLGIKDIYVYTIEEAIYDEIISDFEINVVNCRLSTRNDYMFGPTKSWASSEAKQYKDLTDKFEHYKLMAQIDSTYKKKKEAASRWRMNVIYNGLTKIRAIKHVIAKYPTERKLIFTTRAETADVLAAHSYHSKNKKQNNLQRFIDQEIDDLAVIKMVSMGITIPNLKHAFIHQLESNSEVSVQKILRACNIEDIRRNAVIWLTQYKDTVDEDWNSQALSDIPKEKIKYFEWK